MSLSEFVDRLKQFATRSFPVDEVCRFLQQSRFAGGELQPYLFFDSNHYTRNLIHKSEEFELLAICWEPGQEAPAHGHEGEKCWTRVESGRLRFTNYVETASSDAVDLKVVSTVVGDAGHVDGPADIHRVENRFEEPAVTLHLYSHPYSACDIYDLENRRKIRRTLSYFSRYGKRCD